MGVLGGGIAVLALAWVLSNLLDAPARPRPAELLANASTLPHGEGAAALSALASPRVPDTLTQVCGPALSCVDQWLQQPPAALQPDAEAAAMGARCDALLDSAWRYRQNFAVTPEAPALLQEFPAARACLRWFTREALRQGRGSQPTAALPALRRALRLARTLHAGSDSLLALGQANLLGVQADQAVLALALHAPAVAPALVPLLAEQSHGPADAVAAARRWMSTESALGAKHMALLTPPACQAGGWLPWTCWRHLGFQPQRTQQAVDDRWLALWRSFDAGWLPAVQQAQAAQAVHPGNGGASLGAFTAWRNTSGHILVQVSEGAYTPHLLRQADALLHREATALVVALQAQGVPAAERAAWAARQPLSDDLRQRLVWSADGQHLQVSTWTAAGDGPLRLAFSARWPG